jgi:hypothetical protein
MHQHRDCQDQGEHLITSTRYKRQPQTRDDVRHTSPSVPTTCSITTASSDLLVDAAGEVSAAMSSEDDELQPLVETRGGGEAMSEAVSKGERWSTSVPSTARISSPWAMPTRSAARPCMHGSLVCAVGAVLAGGECSATLK